LVVSGGVAVIQVGAATETVRALEEPARQIANNAGVEGSVIVEEIKRTGKGYNAAIGEYSASITRASSTPRR